MQIPDVFPSRKVGPLVRCSQGMINPFHSCRSCHAEKGPSVLCRFSCTLRFVSLGRARCRSSSQGLSPAPWPGAGLDQPGQTAERWLRTHGGVRRRPVPAAAPRCLPWCPRLLGGRRVSGTRPGSLPLPLLPAVRSRPALCPPTVAWRPLALRGLRLFIDRRSLGAARGQRLRASVKLLSYFFVK